MEHISSRIIIEEKIILSRLEWLTTYVRTHSNPSDIMTKSVSSINNIIRKVRKLLYDIYPEAYDER